MPWIISENDARCDEDSPYAVVKEDDEALVACHATRTDAANQIAALEASEANGKQVDEEELDTVFARYHELVNMSASELEDWSENPCSREASLDRSPIQRNLRLLRKPKAEWTSSDIDAANQTISFISRMLGNEQGDDVVINADGRERNCGSRRDISLRNWAHDPGKSKSKDDAPNYRQAEDESEQVCLTCYFGKNDNYCSLYEFEFETGYTCDAWRGQESAMSKSNRPEHIKSWDCLETKVVDADQGIVEHLITVFGVLDEGHDISHPGSFTKTLSERGGKVRVVDSHNYDSVMRVIGKPLVIREVTRDELPMSVRRKYPDATGGVWARTQFLMDTPEGRGTFARIKSGAIDEWSYGYDAVDTDFDEIEQDDKMVAVRNLRAIRLYEYSPVLWGMNPATAVTDVKSGAMYDCHECDYKAVLSEIDESWKCPKCGAVPHSPPDFEQEKAGLLPEDELGMGEEESSESSKAGEHKAGRVLSERNAQEIVSALTSLITVLERAGVDVPGFGDDDNEQEEQEMYNGTMSTTMQANVKQSGNTYYITFNLLSSDAPAERAAKQQGEGRAGPDSPPTRESNLLNLIEIEKQQIELLEVQ